MAQTPAVKEYQKKYRVKNRARAKAYQREYWQQPENARRRAARIREKRYGLSREDFERRLAEQNNLCAACSEPFGEDNALHAVVDHCHTTNVVRGILHRKCNAAIGILGDDPKALLMVVDYLECAN